MVAIPTAARPTPIPPFQKGVPFVDLKTGLLTQQAQQNRERLRNYVLGCGRIIPCSATAVSNLITLLPNDASPSLEGYIFGDCFPFWAPATSTGAVTATVVPKNGALATLNVYVDGGSSQATASDIVISQFYLACYLPISNANAGGLVLLGEISASNRIRGSGSFTSAAATTKVVSDTNVTATSKVTFTPTNAAAGLLMGSAKSLYLSAKSAGVSFTVATANATNASGTETFDYVITG